MALFLHSLCEEEECRSRVGGFAAGVRAYQSWPVFLQEEQGECPVKAASSRGRGRSGAPGDRAGAVPSGRTGRSARGPGFRRGGTRPLERPPIRWASECCGDGS